MLRKTAAVAIVLAILSGCSHVTIKATLTYPQTNGAAK